MIFDVFIACYYILAGDVVVVAWDRDFPILSMNDGDA